MKKVFAGVLLIAICTGAWPGWDVAARNDEGGLTFYVDMTTIRKNPSKTTVKMWDLIDFKKPQKGAKTIEFLSAKSYQEYDCSEEQTRLLYFSHHTGKMGEGTISYTDNTPGDWRPVAPDSIMKTLLLLACKP